MKYNTLDFKFERIPITKIRYKWNDIYHSIFGGNGKFYYENIEFYNNINFKIIGYNESNKNIVEFNNLFCKIECIADNNIENCKKNNRICYDSKKIFQNCCKQLFQDFRNVMENLFESKIEVYNGKIYSYIKYGSIYRFESM